MVALTVASPDIGLQLRQQQQGTTGYDYQPQHHNQHHNQQHNQQYYNQQQQTFTLNQNENPAPLVPTQQEADNNCKFKNYMIDNKLIEFSYLANAGSQSSSNNYLPPFQHQQAHHNQQYYNQQQQTFTVNQGIDQNMGHGIDSNGGNQAVNGSPLSQGSQNSYNNVEQQEPIITKHVYVHTAPEDDEQTRVQIKQQIARPQKHYKIIFIKAPSSGQVTQQVPAYPQVIKIYFNINRKLIHFFINSIDRRKDNYLCFKQEARNCRCTIRKASTISTEQTRSYLYQV